MGKLSFFTNPASVAVIGASAQAGKVGYTVVENISKSGFQGAVYPINPKAPEILGYKAYPNIKEVPGDVDVAVIVIPAKHVLGAAEQCGEKGVKGIVVITAGFKEIGGEGVELEHKLVEIAKKYGMRIVGPNCLGFVTPTLNCTFASAQPTKGSIAFLSQSGAMLTAILDWAVEAKVGFSNFLSLGNKADVDEVDLIEEIADDPATSIILLYLESIVQGSKFMELIPRCVAKKPVIILKAGTSAAGAAAASSHTGALAGNDIAFDLAFEKAGVLRARTMGELFEMAQLFTSGHLPRGRNFCIVTNAGGPGIISTDAFETYNVGLSALSDATKDALRKVLPAEASVKNPVDIVGDAPPKRYEDAIDIVFKEPDDVVAGALVLVTPQGQTQVDKVAELVISKAKQYPNKFLVCSFMGGLTMKLPAQMLKDAEIPSYDFPEPAIMSTSAAIRYSEMRSRPPLAERKLETVPLDEARVHAIIEGARKDGRHTLLSHETSEIFTLLGVSAPRTKLATSAEEAGAFASELGFPVVMKIMSPQIVHKSDCGGVKLGIKSAEEATAAFTEIMKNAAERGPAGAVLKGVEVQQMVDFKQHKKVNEIIVGMNRDSTWGPMLMVGQGGLFANYTKDVAFELSYKYNREDALRQLKKTKVYTILEGVRGEPRSDIDGLLSTMCKLAQLVNTFPEIKELDMNPLLVFEDAIAAVDVKITLTH